MKKHPVIICSNLTNRYGFRVLASGIKLDAYAKNPIILYAHQRPSRENPKLMPIGKMSDIRIDEKGQLVGNMTFDQNDEFALSVESKWENGYLNAVSLKAEILAVSDEQTYMLPNQNYPTITESLLEEVSVEPIPGDSNAVSLQLHYQGKPVVTLSDEHPFDPTTLFPTTKPKSDMSKQLIVLAFGAQNFVTLAKDATDEQIAEAVSALAKKANENAEQVVTLSAQITEKNNEITQLKDKVKTIELQAVTDKATALVDEAVKAKKITPAQKAEFVELAKTNYETVEKILDSMKGFTQLSKETTEAPTGNEKLFVELSYLELDKKGLIPEFKKANPELFKAKYKERYGKDYSGTDL